jgi:hypothetical protein
MRVYVAAPVSGCSKRMYGWRAVIKDLAIGIIGCHITSRRSDLSKLEISNWPRVRPHERDEHTETTSRMSTAASRCAGLSDLAKSLEGTMIELGMVDSRAPCRSSSLEAMPTST